MLTEIQIARLSLAWCRTLTLPPWALPANKTQSGILTRSTPGGNYNTVNALRFADKKGSEQLWLHAEKDQLTEVEHDEDKWVGNDRIDLWEGES